LAGEKFFPGPHPSDAIRKFLLVEDNGCAVLPPQPQRTHCPAMLKSLARLPPMLTCSIKPSLVVRCSSLHSGNAATIIGRCNPLNDFRQNPPIATSGHDDTIRFSFAE
jgi:hypothetical protein